MTRYGGDKRSSSLTFQRRIFLVSCLIRGSARRASLIADVRESFGDDIYPPNAAAALRHDLAALRSEFGCDIRFDARNGYTLEDVGSFSSIALSIEDRFNNHKSDRFISNSSNIVTMRFDFPEAVKVPCQQYLLYFTEFLRDVGIEATAQITEEAGKALFSVTPKDKDEALDNIREALEIYLKLPMHQVSVISTETSIEVQRLGSQILHLQSQIMLGNAILQQKELALHQKDVIIQQQQTVIHQQLLTGQVLVDSLQREAEDDDAEPLIGNLVKVKRWNPEGIPLDIELPEIMRQLKQRFRRKKKS